MDFCCFDLNISATGGTLLEGVVSIFFLGEADRIFFVESFDFLDPSTGVAVVEDDFFFLLPDPSLGVAGDDNFRFFFFLAFGETTTGSGFREDLTGVEVDRILAGDNEILTGDDGVSRRKAAGDVSRSVL